MHAEPSDFCMEAIANYEEDAAGYEMYTSAFSLLIDTYIECEDNNEGGCQFYLEEAGRAYDKGQVALGEMNWWRDEVDRSCYSEK